MQNGLVLMNIRLGLKWKSDNQSIGLCHISSSGLMKKFCILFRRQKKEREAGFMAINFERTVSYDYR